MFKELKSDFFEYFKTLTPDQLSDLSGQMPVHNPSGHQISEYNTAFLKFQNEEMNFTVIAGYKQWQKFGRCVKKGSKGFFIFIPAMKKTKNEEGGNTSITEEFDRFLMARVFDVSQTFEIKDQTKEKEPVMAEADAF
jgi:antirestriction protein ArdC